MRRITLVVASIAVALLPVQASAAAPTIQHYTILGGPTVISGVCARDFSISSVIPVTETDYFSSSGAPVRISFQATETDTVVGPGGTLTTLPYRFDVQVTFDAAGNPKSVYSNGQVFRVVLPDGSLFESAGRIDELAVTATFIFGPTFGHTGNIAAFCAALGAQ